MPTARPTNPPVVFLAFASVAVGNYEYLPRLADEAKKLREIFEAAESKGRCRLVLRENVTLAEILDVFQHPDLHGRIAVFHFAGHGNSYSLLMEEVAGKALIAYAGGLAAFLAAQEGLRLVFLNACSTDNQVKALHAAGVPAVVATTEDVPDDWAAPFAVRFYKGLAGGASIADSLQAAQGEAHGVYDEREA